MNSYMSQRCDRSKAVPVCPCRQILLMAWLAVALVAAAGAEDAIKTQRSELLEQMGKLAKATEVRLADSDKPSSQRRGNRLRPRIRGPVHEHVKENADHAPLPIGGRTR